MSNHAKIALDTPETGYKSRRMIEGKRFHVLSDEVEVRATVNEVWHEVAGKFVKGAEIAESLNASGPIGDAPVRGLGAERYLDINFQGKRIKAKERIIDFRDVGDAREFTYEVYETKGAPIGLRTFNTWYVRRGADQNTYLGNVFIFRANFAVLTGLIGKMLARSGSIKGGLLTYKHFIETGEKKVSQEKLLSLYPTA